MFHMMKMPDRRRTLITVKSFNENVVDGEINAGFNFFYKKSKRKAASESGQGQRYAVNSKKS